MKISDIITGTILILLGVHVFHVSGKFEVLSKVTFGGPEFFPRFVAVLSMFCSVLLIINACRGKALDKKESVTSQDLLWVLYICLLTIGYVFLIRYLGFFVSSAIYLVCFLIMVKERRPVLIATTGLLVPLMVFLFFVKIMGISLPEGLLF